MILNFTKVDKVRLSLEEYTLNTRLMVKGQKKKKTQPKTEQNKRENGLRFQQENKDKVVLQQWANVFFQMLSYHINSLQGRLTVTLFLDEQRVSGRGAGIKKRCIH